MLETLTPADALAMYRPNVEGYAAPAPTLVLEWAAPARLGVVALPCPERDGELPARLRGLIRDLPAAPARALLSAEVWLREEGPDGTELPIREGVVISYVAADGREWHTVAAFTRRRDGSVRWHSRAEGGREDTTERERASGDTLAALRALVGRTS